MKGRKKIEERKLEWLGLHDGWQIGAHSLVWAALQPFQVRLSMGEKLL